MPASNKEIYMLMQLDDLHFLQAQSSKLHYSPFIATNVKSKLYLIVPYLIESIDAD